MTVASLAIGLWGATVMACVLVTNFSQLVLARVAAAVGEAGCKPPTYSLVGDYFPQPAARTRAMSIYWLGSPLAALVSFILGGWLHDLYGWRMTFFLMGLPALILAVVVKLTVVEPRRGATGTLPEQRLAPPLRAVLAVLWQRRSCRHLSIALILLFTMGSGLAPWYAAFMMRTHGMDTQELGIWLGLIFGFSGLVGVLLGGYVTNRWFASNERGQMRLSAATVCMIVPCYVAFLTLQQKHLALLALIPLMLVFSFFVAPTYSLMQRLVADGMRATTLAVVMLLANLIGMGVGPQIVGALSDALMPTFGIDSLRYALFIMSFVSLWAAYHFWIVGRVVIEDLTRASLEHEVREASS